MASHENSILSGIRDVVSSQSGPVVIDDTDVALLEALVVDGRLSQRQLGIKLGVSAPTVADRMARLERTGVIRGYVADIDWSALGYGQIVHLSISAAAGSEVAAVMSELWKVPELEELHVVTGELDLLAKLRVRDYAHLRAVLMDSIWQINGIHNTSTMLAIAEMPPKDFASGLLAARRADAEPS